MNDMIPTITLHNIYFSILVIFIQETLPFYNIHIAVNNRLIQCQLKNKLHILEQNTYLSIQYKT